MLGSRVLFSLFTTDAASECRAFLFRLFRSERQPVVLRFAEPPALSPWRFAPRGEGDRPKFRFWVRAIVSYKPASGAQKTAKPEAHTTARKFGFAFPRSLGHPNGFEGARLPVGFFFSKKERLPPNSNVTDKRTMNKQN